MSDASTDTTRDNYPLLGKGYLSGRSDRSNCAKLPDLVEKLWSSGGLIFTSGDGRLVVVAPPEVFTPEVDDGLREGKPDILEALPALPPAIGAWPGTWRERFEERAAVREHDGGFPRAEAERLAEEDCRAAFAREGCP